MTCGLCGKSFDESASTKACKGCALFGGCKKVKCPRCGYEMPAEAGLVKWIKRWTNRRR